MSKIIFFMLPEPGHLVPTLRIARALQARGHEVAYLTIPDFRGFVAKQGFGYAPLLGRYFEQGFGVGQIFETQESGNQIYKAIALRMQRENTLPWEEFSRDLLACSPDLAIIDSALTGFYRQATNGTILKRAGFPLVRMSVTFTEEYDVKIPDFIRRVPELILCPHEFDLPCTPPASHERHFVEPSVIRSRPAASFPWELIDCRRKLIYCSFGTQSSAYETATAMLQKIIAALRELNDFQLILSAGGHQHLARFDDLPSNVVILKSVPQLQMLSRASAFITHGGLGSVKEAIFAGVPMVVIPFAHDQPLNARRVEYHGLGIAVCPWIDSPGPIRDAIRGVTGNETMAAQLKTFQSLFSAIEERSPSLDHIEARLSAEEPAGAAQVHLEREAQPLEAAVAQGA
jgi:zeaxanthin glucosyltransferase